MPVGEVSVYSSWPGQEDFNKHVSAFLPFVSRGVGKLDLDISHLVDSEDVVDVSCLDASLGPAAEFRGSADQRELIYMELRKFTDAFVSRQRGDTHWLHDCSLKLFLSQQILFSNEGKFVPESMRDIMSKITLPQCLKSQEISQVNLWINIDQSVSSLHFDGNHNILLVQSGSKLLSLVAVECIHPYILANRFIIIFRFLQSILHLSILEQRILFQTLIIRVYHQVAFVLQIQMSIE